MLQGIHGESLTEKFNLNMYSTFISFVVQYPEKKQLMQKGFILANYSRLLFIIVGNQCRNFNSWSHQIYSQEQIEMCKYFVFDGLC